MAIFTGHLETGDVKKRAVVLTNRVGDKIIEKARGSPGDGYQFPVRDFRGTTAASRNRTMKC